MKEKKRMIKITDRHGVISVIDIESISEFVISRTEEFISLKIIRMDLLDGLMNPYSLLNFELNPLMDIDDISTNISLLMEGKTPNPDKYEEAFLENIKKVYVSGLYDSRVIVSNIPDEELLALYNEHKDVIDGAYNELVVVPITLKSGNKIKDGRAIYEEVRYRKLIAE